MNKVAQLYKQIYTQVKGLMWKDGGPIIGVQIENEYAGPPEYMLPPKKHAVDTGFDVPLYSRTGWTKCKPPLPFGALLPLQGNYPDGFWDRAQHRLIPIETLISLASGTGKHLLHFEAQTRNTQSDIPCFAANSAAEWRRAIIVVSTLSRWAVGLPISEQLSAVCIHAGKV